MPNIKLGAYLAQLSGKKRFNQRSRDSKNTTPSRDRSLNAANAEDTSFTGKAASYAIGAEIGKGAYAVVRQGVNRATGRRVAMKVYEKSRLSNPQRKANVKKEISILKRLKHPHVVGLCEVVNTASKLYIIMELVRGKSLHDFVSDMPLKRLREGEAITLFRQILEAVSYCHANMISHRDIKADNVLVAPEGRVKLIDFGFATLSSPSQRLDLFCGTPFYMPPEIAGRQEYLGPNADIWSLGVLLYYMLSGSYPFNGRSDSALFENIVQGLVAFPPYFSPMAKEFISRMLQVDPEKRPTAMEVMVK